MYDFSPEAMLKAGVPPEDVEYYKSARIAYSDNRSWLRVMAIQSVVTAHQVPFARPFMAGSPVSVSMGVA